MEGTLSFKCEYQGCGRELCSRSNLLRHQRLHHMRIKRYECSVCGKRLSTGQTFRDHMNIHSGATPYLCPYTHCTAAFRQASLFSIHKKFHEAVGDKLGSQSEVLLKHSVREVCSVPFIEMPKLPVKRNLNP